MIDTGSASAEATVDKPAPVVGAEPRRPVSEALARIRAEVSELGRAFPVPALRTAGENATGAREHQPASDKR